MKKKQTRMHATGEKCNGVPSLAALAGRLFGVSMANSDTQEGEIGFANALDLTAGGNPVVPYGQHEHPDGLQVFERADAEALVAHFNTLRQRVRRAVAGLPVYIGHPDHPAFANRHTDSRAYGWIKELRVTDEGLELVTDWTEAGKALVNGQEYRFTSVHWLGRPSGKTPAGKPIVRPVALLSLGLTNQPNIDMAPLGVANESDNQPEPETQDMDLEKLRELLGLSAEATPEEIIAAAEQRLATPPEGEEEETTPDDLATANEQLATVQASLNAERNQRKTLEANLANERKAHVELLLDQAIADGRITPGNKPHWGDRFAKNFDEAHAALANEQPGGAMKTTSVTENLGTTNAATHGSQSDILALVNERLAEKGGTFDQNYRALQRERPELFKAPTA